MMYVNKSFVPHCHQQDWFDFNNDLLNRSLAFPVDAVMPQIIRRQADPCAILSQKIHQKLAQNYPDHDVLPRISGRSADPWAVVSQAVHQHLVSNHPNKFEVKLDVSNFSPEEICVKAVGNSLVIEGKHEERLDND